MRVHRQDISDIGPIRATGVPAYAYVYSVFRFVERGRVLLARSYADQPDTVSLLGLRVGKVDRSLIEADLSDELVQRAIAYLQEQGRSQFRWFDQAHAQYRELDATGAAAAVAAGSAADATLEVGIKDGADATD